MAQIQSESALEMLAPGAFFVELYRLHCPELAARLKNFTQGSAMRHSSQWIRFFCQTILCAAVFAAIAACDVVSPQNWTEEFNVASRKLTSTGESQYFILKPGYQTVLASENDKLTTTVLDETKEINGVTTRVIEEREQKNGELAEVSRNFFALDQETGDVFYFGEEVDFYQKGNIVRHNGAWLAYENGNKPGLIMPGTPAVGMRYFQEIAPGVAMDRAQVLNISQTCATPAGVFQNCLVTEESTPLEPQTRETKSYAPGIGLIQDQRLKLVVYGYINDLPNGK